MCVELLGLCVPVYSSTVWGKAQVVLWPFLSCGFSIKYIHLFIQSFIAVSVRDELKQLSEVTWLSKMVGKNSHLTPRSEDLFGTSSLIFLAFILAFVLYFVFFVCFYCVCLCALSPFTVYVCTVCYCFAACCRNKGWWWWCLICAIPLHCSTFLFLPRDAMHPRY